MQGPQRVVYGILASQHTVLYKFTSNTIIIQLRSWYQCTNVLHVLTKYNVIQIYNCVCVIVLSILAYSPGKAKV